MITLLVQHTVADFDQWKSVFDEHEKARRAHGGSGHRLYRAADDPLALTILTDFPSAEAAQGFAADPSLKDAMQRAGVTSAPTISVLESVEVIAYE